MNDAVLSTGEKVHVISRRLFEGDIRRHFVGEVTAVNENFFRCEGFAFVLDTATNQYHRQPETRTRVFQVSSILVVNVIPKEVEVFSVSYRMEDQRLKATDGKDFSLDINEFGIRT